MLRFAHDVDVHRLPDLDGVQLVFT